MALASDSELAVLLAWWGGIISIILCVLLTLYAALLRALYVYKSQRAASFLLEWEALIAESLDRMPKTLPQVKRRDAVNFLMLWNHLQESLRDESKEKLNSLARQIDMDVVALELLEKGSLDERLLAVNTLGWLKHDTNWKKLIEAVRDPDPVYSLSAARALMRIDPEKAIRELIPLIVSRADWSRAAVGAILKEAGADLISEPLARAALLAPEDRAVNLIPFLEMAHAEVAIPTVQRIMKGSPNLEVITACLRIFRDAGDLDAVRELIKDDRWQVRLQAAACLGRIGSAEDEERLIGATADPEWWVRYRAAQALANLPSMTLERLGEIAERQTDQAARDIIRQVIAEKQVEVL